MIPSKGSGFATLAEEREDTDNAFASKCTRSTSNSRAKRVERKPAHKRWYETEDIASQYLYCVKEPPCQTCCRYNEKVFKTVLDRKVKFPPYKRKMTGQAHLRQTIYQPRPNEEAMKYGSNHGPQGSDVSASTRLVHVHPVHPFHPNVKAASPRWFGREPCNVKISSEAACPDTRSPSKDFSYRVKDTDGVTPNKGKSPFAVARPGDAEKERKFFGRPNTDVTSFSLRPTMITEGVSRSDALPFERSIHYPCKDIDPLLRDTSGKLLRPASCNLASSQPRSQCTSPAKVQPRSPGEAYWRRGEEKEFFCQRSSPSDLCTSRRIANGYEPKLQAESTVCKPFDPPKTGNTSLHSLSRVSMGTSCINSAHSHLRRFPLSSCIDRTFSAGDSSEKLPDSPPIRNPSTTKPPRPPSRAQAITPILSPCAPGKPKYRKSLERKVICKHSPCKPCNISCFDQYYPPNRTHNFDTSYDKPCTLPDIFAGRNNLNLSRRPQDLPSGPPFWRVTPTTASPWHSVSSQTSYRKVRGTAYDKARWKAAIERDTYSGPPKSQKRMYGKAGWKDTIDKELARW